jgi:hypothetical protein
VRETPPPVPVIVSVRVPRFVRELVETVSVEVVPVVELGLNEPDDWFGSPLTEKETLEPKPFDLLTVTAYVVDWPRATLRLAGDTLSVKPGAWLGVPATAVCRSSGR